MGFIMGLGRSPGGGNGNPLQDSSLENPMDSGAWWAIVHGVTKESDMTELLKTHTHTHTHTHTESTNRKLAHCRSIFALISKDKFKCVCVDQPRSNLYENPSNWDDGCIIHLGYLGSFCAVYKTKLHLFL